MPLEPRSSARRLGRVVPYLEGRGGWVALGAACACSIALLLYLGRGTTFYLDEITIFSESKGFDLRYLLSPHDGQLILLARLVYSGVFKLFGADYVLLRVIDACGVAAVGALLYALVRRRVGGALALPAVLVVLFFGTGWEVVLSPVGILNVYCLAAGLGALLALDRGGRFADLLACALLVVAVSSYSFGVAMSVGVAVLVLARPDRSQRAWVFGVPLLLYAAWTIAKSSLAGPLSGATGFDLADVATFPAFAAESIAHITGAVFGLNYNFAQQNPALAPPDGSWGAVLAAVIAAAGGMAVPPAAALDDGVGADRDPPRLLARDHGGVGIQPAAVERALPLPGRGRPDPARRRDGQGDPRDAAAGGGGVRGRRRGARREHLVPPRRVDVPALLQREHPRGPRRDRHRSRSCVAALHPISRRSIGPPPRGLGATPAVPPGDRSQRFVRVHPGRASWRTRDPIAADADAILGQAYSLHVVPAAGPPGRRGCARVGSNDFALPRGGARILAPRGGELVLRRFAEAPTVQVGSIPAGDFAAIRIPGDRAPDPWRGQLTPAQPITVCAL